MATIRKRGNKWQAQVRRQGRRAMSQTFLIKSDAEVWARHSEIALESRDVGRAREQLRGLRLADLLKRYLDKVTPNKRSRDVETTLIRALLRRPLCGHTLFDLDTSHFAEYRDHRLRKVKLATVARELGLINHCLEIARREWNIPIDPNPMDQLRRPKGFVRRDRRLQDGEMDRLMTAATTGRNPYIAPLVRFAVETGMRRGELLRARWQDVDVKAGTLHIPTTKNGHPRTIPLTPGAFRVLVDLQPTDREFIFPTTPSAVKQAWRRLARRAQIRGLRFHDLRHEAISRFFEYGLTVPEVALVSGHRDPRMLLRYAHGRSIGNQPEALLGGFQAPTFRNACEPIATPREPPMADRKGRHRG
jgi:integrase